MNWRRRMGRVGVCIQGDAKVSFCTLFIQSSFPHVFVLPAFFPLKHVLVPFWRRLGLGPLGALPVIPLKIWFTQKRPKTARAQTPEGGAVLESLFEGADRLTLKARCSPQMCHLVQKKLPFFLLAVPFSMEHKRKKPGGYFWVICSLPSISSHVSFLCKLQSRQGSWWNRTVALAMER